MWGTSALPSRMLNSSYGSSPSLSYGWYTWSCGTGGTARYRVGGGMGTGAGRWYEGRPSTLLGGGKSLPYPLQRAVCGYACARERSLGGRGPCVLVLVVVGVCRCRAGRGGWVGPGVCVIAGFGGPQALAHAHAHATRRNACVLCGTITCMMTGMQPCAMATVSRTPKPAQEARRAAGRRDGMRSAGGMGGAARPAPGRQHLSPPAPPPAAVLHGEAGAAGGGGVGEGVNGQRACSTHPPTCQPQPCWAQPPAARCMPEPPASRPALTPVPSPPSKSRLSATRALAACLHRPRPPLPGHGTPPSASRSPPAPWGARQNLALRYSAS